MHTIQETGNRYLHILGRANPLHRDPRHILVVVVKYLRGLLGLPKLFDENRHLGIIRGVRKVKVHSSMQEKMRVTSLVFCFIRGEFEYLLSRVCVMYSEQSYAPPCFRKSRRSTSFWPISIWYVTFRSVRKGKDVTLSRNFQ